MHPCKVLCCHMKILNETKTPFFIPFAILVPNDNGEDALQVIWKNRIL